MPAQLLTFHRSASAHKSRQVLVSSDLYIFIFFKGVRIQSRRSSWSWRPQCSWDTTVGLMCWCADDEQVALIAEAEQVWIVGVNAEQTELTGCRGRSQEMSEQTKKRRKKHLHTNQNIPQRQTVHVYTETQEHVTLQSQSMQKLCNDLRVLVFTERADPPVCSEHIAYCVRVRISCVQHAAKWTWITIFLSQSEMCWNHLVLDTAGRVSTPQEVSSDHSEGSLMSQSVSVPALEDVQAYFSKCINMTIKDCRPLAGVLKAVLTWTEKNPLISNEQELKKELKPTVNT